jgi:peptidyl-prolyl cis-trans isomerase SurA
MQSKIVRSIISVCCLYFFASGASDAQNVETGDAVSADAEIPHEAVAAVVNDRVITTFDVRQRLRLALISAGGRIPIEALPQLEQQVLRDLIDEKLKLQELQKYEFEATDTEIERELALIAAESNLPVADFLAALTEQGAAVASLKDQVRVAMLWPRLVQGRYRDRVRVSEDEIEQTLQRMREDATHEQYRVSEICIPVDDPARAQQYYQAGLQLIEQMRRGVPFAFVAQQFSACTTAAVGGDMGWVRAGELPPELDQVVRNLEPGSVTNPIPSQGAFMILSLQNKQEAVIAGEPTFTLGYASAPLSMGETAARAAFDKLATADPCSGRALRQDLGAHIGYALLENVTLDAIDPRFREWIEDLNRGEMSAALRADDAFHAAYVCDKDEGLGLPSRDALENNIMARQLNRISQQYLRDIERKASIDIRLDRPDSTSG